MTKEIVIYHSPDSDDAFMFWGIQSGAVSEDGYKFSHILRDIQTLNLMALEGKPDVTAVSVYAYTKLFNTYNILECGASMGGKDYGPTVVSKSGGEIKENTTLAVPGSLTTASLVLQLYLKDRGITSVALKEINFSEIEDAVLNGAVDAGVLIHEGQLTHQEKGLKTVVNLGEWWWQKHSLPLPLGINIVKKTLPLEDQRCVFNVLQKSIVCGLENFNSALEYALEFGRGLNRDKAEKFVKMYVNQFTKELGDIGKKAIALLIKEGQNQGIIKERIEEIFFVSNEGVKSFSLNFN
ncbi:MAG: ABC transporter substrate-binding protein [Candidatus Dadabacteria bacterium]|nr:MAG: ABC transporter substrate-binding protein [Candidatus Dadabacteria bacterium]